MLLIFALFVATCRAQGFLTSSPFQVQYALDGLQIFTGALFVSLLSIFIPASLSSGSHNDYKAYVQSLSRACIITPAWSRDQTISDRWSLRQDRRAVRAMFLETVEAVENAVAQRCSEVNVLSRHAILSLHHLEPSFGTLPLSSYSRRPKLCRALQSCRLTKIRQGQWSN